MCCEVEVAKWKRGSHAEVESLEQGLRAVFKRVFQELQELTFRPAKI